MPLLNGANLLMGVLVSMVIDRAKEVPTRGSARLTDLPKVGMDVIYVQERGDGEICVVGDVFLISREFGVGHYQRVWGFWSAVGHGVKLRRHGLLLTSRIDPCCEVSNAAFAVILVILGFNLAAFDTNTRLPRCCHRLIERVAAITKSDTL